MSEYVTIKDFDNVTITSDEWSSSTHTRTIVITPNEGYSITSAFAYWYQNYKTGYYVTQASPNYGEEQEDGTYIITAYTSKQTTTVYVSGTTETSTEEEETTELNIINNITDTTETHTYDSESGTAVITITGSSGIKYRITEATAEYTNTSSESATIEAVITYSDGTSTAIFTITDADTNETITINGTYTNDIIRVSYSLSNCTTDGAEYYLTTDDTSQTITATAATNCLFESTPLLSYQDNDTGYINVIYFSVDEDKANAVLSFTPTDLSTTGTATITATATAQTTTTDKYGSVYLYLVNEDELTEFAQKRFFTNADALGYVYETVDLGQFVHSLRRVYVDITDTTADTIKAGNYNTRITTETPNTDIITLDCGDVYIPYTNENAADYANTTIKLFLPFFGYEDINALYIGKTLNIKYIINLVTTSAIIQLYADGILFDQKEADPATDVYFRSTYININQAEMIGGDKWNINNLKGFTPYLLIYTYAAADAETHKTQKERTQIKNKTGYIEAEEVCGLNNNRMLADEYNQIIKLLQNGVTIEENSADG